LRSVMAVVLLYLRGVIHKLSLSPSLSTAQRKPHKREHSNRSG